MDGDFSKVDVAYSKLKVLVTQYDLVPERHLRILPGEHLHIDELSDRVRASATPVRQALERLHGDGLIDCIPKRGFFSKVPDAGELQDLNEFALLVLDHSIVAASSDLSAAAPLEPDTSVVTMPPVPDSAAGPTPSAIAVEGVFERIARLSRNGQMLRMIRNFNDRSRYLRCLALSQCPDPAAHVREAVSLVDLIRRGEIDSARSRLHAFMTREVKHLPEVIRFARSRWADAEAGRSDSVLGETTKRQKAVSLAARHRRV
jgi:DNA-binding GntR family transcriptional regulator